MGSAVGSAPSSVVAESAELPNACAVSPSAFSWPNPPCSHALALAVAEGGAEREPREREPGGGGAAGVAGGVAPPPVWSNISLSTSASFLRKKSIPECDRRAFGSRRGIVVKR